LTALVVLVCVLGRVHDMEGGNFLDVIGHSHVEAEPNVALVGLRLESMEKELEEALNKINEYFKSVKEVTDDFGIEEKELKTVHFFHQAVYSWMSEEGSGGEMRRELSGYRAVHLVQVRITDDIQDTCSRLVNELIQRGPLVEYVHFTLQGSESYYQKSIGEAVDRAKDKAQKMIEGLEGGDYSLGEILSIQELPDPTMLMRHMMLSPTLPAGLFMDQDHTTSFGDDDTTSTGMGRWGPRHTRSTTSSSSSMPFEDDWGTTTSSSGMGRRPGHTRTSTLEDDPWTTSTSTSSELGRRRRSGYMGRWRKPRHTRTTTSSAIGIHDEGDMTRSKRRIQHKTPGHTTSSTSGFYDEDKFSRRFQQKMERYGKKEHPRTRTTSVSEMKVSPRYSDSMVEYIPGTIDIYSCVKVRFLLESNQTQ